MFTGIIQEVGILQKRERREGNLILTIQAKELTPKLEIGGSIAVNGVCLTCEHRFQDSFKVSLIPETEKLTNLGTLHVSSRVNLELGLPVTGRIDGHFVTGHVDGIGEVITKGPMEGGIGLSIRFPETLAKFLSMKGSVALNGVSLTILSLENDMFTVGLIPFTQQHTNLSTLLTGDHVNIEVDLIARYLDRLLEGKTEEVKYEWLKERNFI